METSAETKLSTGEVARLAKLAHLSLTPAQAESLRSDLTSILQYVERLRKLDLTGVEPLYSPRELDALPAGGSGPIQGSVGADVAVAGLPAGTVAQLAPDSIDGFVRVPRVLAES